MVRLIVCYACVSVCCVCVVHQCDSSALDRCVWFVCCVCFKECVSVLVCCVFVLVCCVSVLVCCVSFSVLCVL